MIKFRFHEDGRSVLRSSNGRREKLKFKMDLL